MALTRLDIILAVTNDLTYDRRMNRICQALEAHGYKVGLVGRVRKNSTPLSSKPYTCFRLPCWFTTGFLFYAEYNLRLFFFLMRLPYQVACACDLDTALAVRLASRLKDKKSVYDAHEFFTEVPEVTHRAFVKSVWEWIGRRTIPHFDLRYTVGAELASLMSRKYRVPFEVIRNIEPFVQTQVINTNILDRKRILFYQGALNVGRGLEVLINAMVKLPDWTLWLAGEGDISKPLQHTADQLGLGDRVKFLGWIVPEKLPGLMSQARLGINLRNRGSLNDFYSLPNKFFDFIQAGLPSINMNYPEYQHICLEFDCAVLLDELSASSVVNAVSRLDQNPELLNSMVKACHEASLEFTWEKESAKLIDLYDKLIPVRSNSIRS
ncbi:MAG TPA: glycosyltransferase [Saprospiraceae bacterium]|nr:glycosyltransferase [Saprospiraceae bacterium]